MAYKWLIVGCGISGATLAHKIATELNEKVLIIDKRPHLGGNIYDYKDENEIFVHKYGPHAFHTENKNVWDFLSKFTKWHAYSHRVLAYVDEKLVVLPFNFDTLRKLFPPDKADKLEKKLCAKYGFGSKIPFFELQNSDDEDLKQLGEYIYKKFYEGYSCKQWGITPDKIDKSVLGRVPIVLSKDDRYFHDKYQGIPIESYTKMIKNMLDNPLIDIKLNTSFNEIKDKIKYDKLIYTGMIDEFFDFKYGKLPYRSLNFAYEEVEQEYFQPSAQVNYSQNYDYTRITEFKHFLDTKTEKTVIAYEYPQEFIYGENEPYYPVENEQSRALYNKYLEEDFYNKENTYFIGRLAQYKYYNMDKAVEAALNLFEDKILTF